MVDETHGHVQKRINLSTSIYQSPYPSLSPHLFAALLVDFWDLMVELISLCGLSVVCSSPPLKHTHTRSTNVGYKYIYIFLSPQFHLSKPTHKQAQTSKHKPTCGHAWMHVAFWDVKKFCFCGEPISFEKWCASDTLWWCVGIPLTSPICGSPQGCPRASSFLFLIYQALLFLRLLAK